MSESTGIGDRARAAGGRGAAPRRLRLRRYAGFAVALSLTLLLVFNGGGYDVVIRHEVGLALWALIALGLGVGILPRARLAPSAWVALGGFAALAGLTLLATGWAASDERTIDELARVLQYMALVALAYLALNRYTWRGAALGFATGALIVPLFGVGARLFPDQLSDVFATLGTDRLSYPLEYWNGVACWGAMAVAAGLALSANAARTLIRAAALAVVPVAAVSVYLTYSRFGVAAVTIAVIAAIALSRHRWTAALNAVAAAAASAAAILVTRGQDEIARATGDAGAETVLLTLIGVGAACAVAAAMTSGAGLDRVRMDRRTARLGLAAAGVGVLLLAAALNRPLADAWDEFKSDRPSVATRGTERLTTLGGSRYDVWSSAVDAFESEPWRGIGPGSFEYHWSRHGDRPEYMRDAHSLYIEQGAELGVPGVIALLAALGGLLTAALRARRGWRRRRELAAGAAVIAPFVVFLAYAGIDWMWELGAVGTLALGGAAVAGAGGLDRAPRWAPPPWVRAVCVVAALAAAAIQVPGLVSTQRVRASESALVDGNLERARELADEAISAQSWAASPYAARALVSEREREFDQARSDITEAIDRDPDNWRHHLLLARLGARAGDRRAVQAELREVRRLAPDSPYLAPLSPYRQQLDKLLAGNEPG